MIREKRNNDCAMPDRPAFTFRAAQVFVAIVEAQSVTRAAKRLGMSASSVSQQLANLEAALESRLIERNARMFRLTPAGTLFLRRALAILDDVSAAKAELVLADQAPRMTLRVATIEEFDAAVTPHWLAALGRAFPNIAFSISSGASHENHDALANRAADLILAVDASEPAEWVESHDILRDTFVLATSRDPDDVTDLATLSERPFLRYARDLYIGRQIEAALRRARLKPDHRYDFTTNRALFAMVGCSGGWAVTTALAAIGTPESETAIRVQRLPLPAFSRRLALHARRDTLGALPERMAAQLRHSINAMLLPRLARTPGLMPGDLTILAPDTEEANISFDNSASSATPLQ